MQTPPRRARRRWRDYRTIVPESRPAETLLEQSFSRAVSYETDTLLP